MVTATAALSTTGWASKTSARQGVRRQRHEDRAQRDEQRGERPAGRAVGLAHAQEQQGGRGDERDDGDDVRHHAHHAPRFGGAVDHPQRVVRARAGARRERPARRQLGRERQDEQPDARRHRAQDADEAAVAARAEPAAREAQADVDDREHHRRVRDAAERERQRRGQRVERRQREQQTGQREQRAEAAARAAPPGVRTAGHGGEHEPATHRRAQRRLVEDLAAADDDDRDAAARTPAPAVSAGPGTRATVPGRAAPAPNSGDELIRNTVGEPTLRAGGAGVHIGTRRCTHRRDVVYAQVRRRPRARPLATSPHQAISGVP